MKLLTLLLLITSQTYGKLPSQSEIRGAFQKAAVEEKSCRNLLKILGDYNEKNNPLFGGYKACATMIMAKYVFNPFTKMSYFSKGKSLLEKCITVDKQNIELRYLRYTIQRKVPFFLQYRSSINEDKRMISDAVVNLKDAELKKMISEFLIAEKNSN